MCGVSSPYDWYRWACEVECDGPATQAVLFALVRHVDADGVCWTGHERLARYASASRKTASRSLARLEQMGIISRRRRAGRTDVVQIHQIAPTLDRESEGADRESEGVDSVSVRTESPGGWTESPRVRTLSPDTLDRESTEESIEESTEESTQVSKKGESDVAEVWEHYRQAWKRTHGSALNKTPPKRSGLPTVIREHGVETSKRLVDWWEQSDDDRATFLRSKKIGHTTLFRPSKAASYIAEWVAPWWEQRSSYRPTSVAPESSLPRYMRHLKGFRHLGSDIIEGE